MLSGSTDSTCSAPSWSCKDSIASAAGAGVSTGPPSANAEFPKLFEDWSGIGKWGGISSISWLGFLISAACPVVSSSGGSGTFLNTGAKGDSTLLEVGWGTFSWTKTKLESSSSSDCSVLSGDGLVEWVNFDDLWDFLLHRVVDGFNSCRPGLTFRGVEEDSRRVPHGKSRLRWSVLICPVPFSG